MKAIFLRAVMLIGLLAILMPATAQIGAGRLNHYDVDTLTNADTLALGLVKALEDEYTYTWQVSATNLSDTTNVTGYVQERMSDDHAWVNRDTISFSDTGSTLVTGNTQGLYQRLVLYSANTGATSVEVSYWYRRRKF